MKRSFYTVIGRTVTKLAPRALRYARNRRARQRRHARRR